MKADSKANLQTNKSIKSAAFNLRRIPLIFLGAIIGTAILLRLAPRTCTYLTIVFALLLIFFVIFIRKTKYFTHILCILIGLLIAGVSTSAHGYAQQSRSATLYDVKIAGRITDSSQCDNDGNLIYDDCTDVYLDSITVDGKSRSGKLRVSLPKEYAAEISVGDVVNFTGTLSPIEYIFNDSASVRLRRNGVYYSAVLNSDNDCFSYQLGNLAFAKKARLKLRKILNDYTSEGTSGFMYAMTFGDSKYLDASLTAGFRTTGTAHLLAVSGLHIGVISAAAVFALKKLKLPYAVITPVNTALLLMYCALCSFTPSVTRATLMITVGLVGKTLGLRNDIMSTVSFSGCILLGIKPFYLYDLGFLMSFAAVFGIILCGAPLKRTLSKILPDFAASALAISLAANIGLLPVTLKYFGGISLSFILANFITVPLATLVFPIYLAIAAICCIFPALGAALTYTSIPFSFITEAVTAISKLPQLSFNLSLPSIAFAPYYAALFVLSPYFAKCKLKNRASVTAVAACAVIFLISLSSINPIGYGVTAIEKSGTQYAIIQSDKGTYLAINGTPDDNGLQQCRKTMSNAGIFAINGIIMPSPTADDIV
ncbi:MAG: competence protein ComEC family protein, partial [Clostridia bacterium]|nr:competence protein ComEC family protein [Clostridia bacterium]